jgi:hypothetical protein
MKKAMRFINIGLITLFWLVAILVKFKFHGLYFGLDFGLYHPDGSLYTLKTLRLLGHSELEASRQISEWYQNHASKAKIIDPSILANRPGWQDYNLRILYPLLSTPFVYLFGIAGMLAVPALSFYILILFSYRLCARLDQPTIGILIAFFLSQDLIIGRWMLMNGADSLVVALMSIFVYSISRNLSTKIRIVDIILILATSATRVVMPMWLAISCVFISTKHTRKGLTYAIFSILLFLPVLFLSPLNAISPNANKSGILGKILYLPYSAIKICTFEVLELIALDRILLVAIIFSIYESLKTWEKLSSKFFILVLVALIFIETVNGVIGTNFRYEMPLIPFMVWVLSDLKSPFTIKKNISD